jgi:flagellar basal body-associated protein FliL
MTPHKKPIPIQWIAIGLTAFMASAGVITAFAVTGEKVKQLEAKTIVMCSEQKEIDRDNSIEHKAILNSLTRIETKLEYVQTPGRGPRRPGER